MRNFTLFTKMLRLLDEYAAISMISTTSNMATMGPISLTVDGWVYSSSASKIIISEMV